VRAKGHFADAVLLVDKDATPTKAPLPIK
jgi:hypothetical protein